MNLRESPPRILDERRISRRPIAKVGAATTANAPSAVNATRWCDVGPLASAACQEPEQEPSARQSHHPKHAAPEPARRAIEFGERQSVVQPLFRLVHGDRKRRETISAGRARPTHDDRIISPIDRQISRGANKCGFGGIGRCEPQINLSGSGGLAENPVPRPQVERSEGSTRHVLGLGFHRGERIRRLPQRGTVI